MSARTLDLDLLARLTFWRAGRSGTFGMLAEDGNVNVNKTMTCPDCSGVGVVRSGTCFSCDGRGYLTEERCRGRIGYFLRKRDEGPRAVGWYDAKIQKWAGLLLAVAEQEERSGMNR